MITEKIALVTNVWLDGPGRVEKIQRMRDFYSDPRFHDILPWRAHVLLDNGSSNPKSLRFSDIVNFHPRLEHGNHEHDFAYPGSWRAVYYLRGLLDLYDKLVWLDDDAYILSAKLTQYIADLREGWTSFHVPKYNFPEAGFFVICRKGGLPVLEAWCSRMPWERRVGQQMELELPLTHVERGFIGDRYGETETIQKAEWDHANQVGPNLPLQFDMLGACRRTTS